MIFRFMFGMFMAIGRPLAVVGFIRNTRLLVRDFGTKTLLSSHSVRIEVPTPEDMEDVGAVLSVGSKPGDVILMSGDLGAGKTCFARGFIRSRTGIADQRVTSPTYLLSNSYPAGDTTIYHMDLYRLSGNESDLDVLNMDYVMENCISLIEWPSRLGRQLPTNRLEITLNIADVESTDESDDEAKARIVKFEPFGDTWNKRIDHILEEAYLDDLIID